MVLAITSFRKKKVMGIIADEGSFIGEKAKKKQRTFK